MFINNAALTQDIALSPRVKRWCTQSTNRHHTHSDSEYNSLKLWSLIKEPLPV
jgi:hypothetical protein